MKFTGEKARKRREKLNLSQEDVARGVGCSLSMVRFVETGRRNGSIELAERWEAFLLEREAATAKGRKGKE